MPRRKNPGDLEKNKNPGEKTKTGKQKKINARAKRGKFLGYFGQNGYIKGETGSQKEKNKNPREARAKIQQKIKTQKIWQISDLVKNKNPEGFEIFRP